MKVGYLGGEDEMIRKNEVSTLDHVSTPNKWLLESVTTQADLVRELESRPTGIEHARVDLLLAIREAHAAGHTLRAIAEAAGISHQRVAQLLKKNP